MPAARLIPTSFASFSMQLSPKPTFFLCHASEDKENVVRRVAGAMDRAGISYWMDEEAISWGDEIPSKIQYGLANCEFVIVFVSEAFLGKSYAKAEMQAAVHRESMHEGQRVLPVLVGGPEVRDRFTRDFALVAHKKFLEWTGDTEGLVREAQRLIEKRAMKSVGSDSQPSSILQPHRRETIQSSSPARPDSIPMPTPATPITDLDRAHFLKQAMAVVDEVFRQGLETIRAKDQGWVVDREESGQDFTVTLWLHGKEKGFCRVWLDRERENICYTEMDRSGTGNHTNEQIRPVEKSGVLRLQLLFGQFLTPTTRKNDLTPTEAAQALWERFCRGIR